MKSGVKTGKGILLKGLLLVFALLVVGSGLAALAPQPTTSASPGSPTPSPSADTVSNKLEWAGQNCNNLTTDQYNNNTPSCAKVIGDLAGYDPACNNLGFQDANNQDNWFVNLPNYRACYDKSVSAYNHLGSTNCKTINPNNNGNDWQSCQGDQGFLQNTLSCSGAMYSKNSNGTYTLIQSKYSACKSNLDAAGNVTLAACPNHPVSSSQCAQTAANRSTSSSNSDNNGSNQTNVTCDSSGFVLAWITCTVIYGAQDAINNIYSNFIEPLLTINSHQLLDPNQGYYQVWSTFRVYADIILIIVLLIIVYGQVIGRG